MRRIWVVLLASVLLGGSVVAQEAADGTAPEMATPLGVGEVSPELQAALALKAEGAPVQSEDWMVVAAHPLAVEAGARVLREGGTAADAMVAVQAVLGLVEPQSSGLGGGGFLVWYDAASGSITTLDGRETAPLEATPRLFQNVDGTPMGFWQAVIGGRSVGVPGVPALMEDAHRRWGRANWRGLFGEAIQLAEDGFPVSKRMAASVSRDAERLASHPVTRRYFLPEGAPLAEGHLLKNPAYGRSLRALAEQGAAPFYSGDIARHIVQAVRTAPNPGLLSMVDMALYRVKERPPVCAAYRGYDVCGMGPPSSGGLAVGQILGLASPFRMFERSPEDAESWRIIGDASRLAFADRGRFVADSDFVPVPAKGMLDKDYLRTRAELLRGDDALPEVVPGAPEFDHARAPDDAIERPSTTHISIVDAYGNALSMTSSVENGFGSRVMAGGFLLNNQLTDFSFRSHRGGVPVANRVEPGKRPRSSMSPTIVLRDGKPVLVLGSPGGSRIIGYVAKTIIAHLDWGLDVQQAVTLPHLVNRFGMFDLEDDALAGDLRAIGYEVKVRGMNSGLHAISIDGGLRGGADPRREGVALGN